MSGGLLPCDFDFAPDAGRVRRVDDRVRRRLKASLETIVTATSGQLHWPEENFAALLNQLRAGPVPAVLMALYTDLVEALFEDDARKAQSLVEQLLTPRDVPQNFVSTLDDASLGFGQAERYLRIISDGGVEKLLFNPFSADELQGFEPVFADAFSLLAAAAPELSGEISVLIRQIVLADPRRPPSPVIEIGGSSIFYLWGASFICFNQMPSRLDLAEALAHEAAHLLLFGLTLGKPLVLNGREAVFSSPLRDDKRPMDGLVHAAYVVARLTWLMQAVQQSGALSAAETATAASWEARNRRDFAAVLGVIEEQAKFTDEGAAAFAGAAAYMRELAA